LLEDALAEPVADADLMFRFIPAAAGGITERSRLDA